MMKNLLKTIAWALAFLVFAACVPFMAVGVWAMDFMAWLHKDVDA